MVEKLDPHYNKPPDDPLFVECKETPLTRKQMAYYLNEAWKEVFNKYPSRDSLALLFAQTVLETGGILIRCWNWGNIKKLAGSKYTSYKAGEYFNGKYYVFYPYHPQTFFTAWDSPLNGAVGYIEFLSKKIRYQKAWQAVLEGNAIKYCVELKAANYFTAALEDYMNTVLSLVESFKKHANEYLSWIPPETPKEQIESISEVPIPIPEEPQTPEDIDIPESPQIPEETKEPDEIKKEPISLIQCDDKEKLNTISKIFFMIWTYILKLIEYCKKKD